MNSYTIACVGDPHYKKDNKESTHLFERRFIKMLPNIKPDVIILLGDLLHDHEKLHTLCLNRIVHFIKELTRYAPVFIIVGNHDMINQHEFLSSNHWMNILKDYANVTIIDKTTYLEQFNITLLPYVHTGRFKEALDYVNDDP